MALCELLKNTIHDSRDDPERQSVHHAKQIPMLLFKDEHLEQVDSLVKVTAAAQVNHAPSVTDRFRGRMKMIEI